MPGTLEERVSRLLDQLEDPTLSDSQEQALMRKLRLLQELQDQHNS
jgi:hypothetical protein